MNAYKPWELEGMSEEQFWRRKYIEVEMENGRLRAVVEAAKKVAIGVRKQIEAQEAGFVSMGDLVALEAALEKVGGGE